MNISHWLVFAISSNPLKIPNNFSILRIKINSAKLMSAASVLMKIDCVYSTNVLASEKVYVKLQIMAELSMEKSRKTFSFNGNVRVTRAGTMPNIAKFFWIDCKTLNFGNSDFSISVKKICLSDWSAVHANWNWFKCGTWLL